MTRHSASIALSLAVLAATAVAQDASFQNDVQRNSYALGMNLAAQLRARSLEVEPDALTRGLKDALAGGRTLLTNAQAQGIVTDLQRQASRSGPAAGGTPAEVARLAVSFKLDARLATPTYGGERWVSPPTYTKVGEGRTCTVETRAVGLDARGRRVPLSPTWTPTDADMVEVTPAVGGDVKVLVKHAGESSVRLAAATLSRELAIKAAYQNDVLKVDISQK